ncbi:MAG: hypothetical protein HPY83_15140 [Anaerolineae bacterium]|nr:hypothetical protein [Anaerolineae bacterium]
MILLVLYHLIVALLLWMGSVRLFRELEGLDRRPGPSVVASLVPPLVYLLMALALRSLWWVALGAGLSTTAILGLAQAVGRWLGQRLEGGQGRFAGALRPRTVEEMLRTYLEQGRQEEAARLLDRSITGAPYDRLKVQLLWAASELTALREGATIARSSGAPAVLVGRVHDDLREAGAALAHTAGAAAAASAQGVATPAMEEAVDREVEKLRRFSAAVLAAREGLAQVTLSGSDSESELAQVADRLQAVAEAARELSRGL